MSPVAQRVFEFTYLDFSALWIRVFSAFSLLCGCRTTACRVVALRVELQVQGEEQEGEHGAGLGMGEGTDLGDGLGWQVLSSVSSSSLPPPRPFPPPPPPPFPPPAPCPSSPSEFSSISWMRGGMEPGISIFSVITRSAPFTLMLLRSVIFISILGNMQGLSGLLLLT